MPNTAPSIGQTGGLTWCSQIVPTVTANSAYASGQSVGGVQVVSDAFINSSGIVQNVTILDKNSQSIGMNVMIFNQQPSSSYPDKSAVTLSAADMLKVVGIFTISSGSRGWTTAGGVTISTTCPLGIPVAMTTTGTRTTMWVLPIATSAGTFTTTSGLIFNYGMLQD